MLINPAAVSTFCILMAAFHGGTVDGDCLKGNENLTETLRIEETAQPGYVFLNISSDVGDIWTFTIVSVNAEEKWTEQMTLYFSLEERNNTYTFTLIKELDIEAVNMIMGLLYNITIQFTCQSNTMKQIQVHDMELVVIPVDEFPPMFIGTPFSVMLTEETDVGSVVLDLGSRVEDDDVLSEEERVFLIVPYMIRQFDGSSMFSIRNNATGHVTLEKDLDYEAMTRQFGRPFYMINVTVQDGSKLMSYTRVNLTVTDADDQGPEFLHVDCDRPCLNLELTTHINRNFTGSILEHNLHARDQDTQNHVIEYYLMLGNLTEDKKNEDYFKVDKLTGEVSEIRPLSNLSVSSIHLTVKAQELSEKGHYIYANINIYVDDLLYVTDTNSRVNNLHVELSFLTLTKQSLPTPHAKNLGMELKPFYFIQ